MLLLAGPLLIATVLLATLPLELPVPPLVLAALAGGLALVLIGMILLSGDPQEAPLDRAIDHAWEGLVPELLGGDWTAGDQALVAALAAHTKGHGDPAVRAEILDEVCTALEMSAARGGPASYLGAVRRLALEDGSEGEDVVVLLVDQIARCFDGGLALAFLSTLLAPLPDEVWTPEAHRRLRVLVAMRAFDAGLELRELLDLGMANPALGEILDLKKPDYLAHLRLLHALQAARPWERVGQASTIFEIAKDARASARLLLRRPDVLLTVEDRGTIHLCARGVFFQDAWFFEPPHQIEIVGRSVFSADGYHLVIGPHKFGFADDPGDLAARLEKWFRFFFQEFRPRLEAVYRGRSEAAARRLLVRNGIACPECRRRVLPVPGEVGIGSEPPRGVDVPLVLPA